MAFPAVIWHLRALISMEIGLQKKITVTGIVAEQQAVAYSTFLQHNFGTCIKMCYVYVLFGFRV